MTLPLSCEVDHLKTSSLCNDMFSGGIVSHNLGEVITLNSSQQANLGDPGLTGVRKSRKKSRRPSQQFLNWNERRRKVQNCANLRPTYVVEVKGSICWRSPATAFTIFGACVLFASFIVMLLTGEVRFTPIGIAVGIYVIILASSTLLHRRDEDTRLVAVPDLYVEHAVKMKRIIGCVLSVREKDNCPIFCPTCCSEERENTTSSSKSFDSDPISEDDVEQDFKSMRAAKRRSCSSYHRSDSSDSFESSKYWASSEDAYSQR